MSEHTAVPPLRQTNESRRGREYLEEAEVRRLMKAAGKLGRHGHRDATMVLLAFRHGLRVSELVELRWDQVNLDERTLYCRRKKGSKSGQHTMEPDEVTMLRKLTTTRSAYVFVNERGGPLSESGFFKICARAGEAAKLGFPCHPHMLRHACGYELTRQGVPTRLVQEWLGHKNIQHTVRYTELDPDRFRKVGMWGKRGR